MIYVSKELRNFILNFLNMLKISSATFEDKLDPTYREVNRDRVHANYLRIIPSSMTLLLVEICAIIINLFVGTSAYYQIVFVITFVIFVIVSLVLLFYINHTLSTGGIGERTEKASYISYWIIYTLCELSFCIIEMLDSGSTYHYFIFILTFTLWPMFTPAMTIPFYCTGIAVETVMLYFAGAEYMTYLYCYLITVIGLVASYIKFSSYMSNNLLKKQLEQMAEVDPLTGLMNRRGMTHSIDVIWEYCRRNEIPVTIAMLDIDFFKLYNDTFGHASGDECLQKIAECIKSCFGRRTDITVRYGGEEFVIVVSGEPDKQVIPSLIKLQNMIEGMGIKSGNRAFSEYVTVSIGAYYTLIDGDTDFKTVLQLADKELYNAKENGRKCLSFKGELYNNH